MKLRSIGGGNRPPNGHKRIIDPIVVRFRWHEEGRTKTFTLGQALDKLIQLNFKRQELVRMALMLEITNSYRHPEVVNDIRNLFVGEAFPLDALYERMKEKGVDVFTPFRRTKLKAEDVLDAISNATWAFMLSNVSALKPEASNDDIVYDETSPVHFLEENWQAEIRAWLLDL